MKAYLVEYQVTKRKKTRAYSCVVQAESVRLAKQVIEKRGGKALRATRVA
jgi:hypothetical protein